MANNSFSGFFYFVLIWGLTLGDSVFNMNRTKQDNLSASDYYDSSLPSFVDHGHVVIGEMDWPDDLLRLNLKSLLMWVVAQSFFTLVVWVIGSKSYLNRRSRLVSKRQQDMFPGNNISEWATGGETFCHTVTHTHTHTHIQSFHILHNQQCAVVFHYFILGDIFM